MSTQGLIPELEQDHQRVTESLARLIDSETASDHALLREEWGPLEARVLRHLDAEEMFLLPGFQRERPAEAVAIRDQHALIRKQLGEIGIAIDLHLLRPGQVTAFRDLLLSHVDQERQSLYVWAHAQADEPSVRLVLQRIERAAHSERTSSALATVLRVCQDGEKGYRAAASDVRTEGYQFIFQHYAEQRAGFAKALDEAVRRLGVTAPAGGSVGGAVHRGWLDLRAAIESGKPQVVLRECCRGEAAALRAYREALRADLLPDMREVVQDQYEAVKKARAEMAVLADAAGS